MACSAAQLRANRNNAARSTGPRTGQGKEISRRNGLKYGLTGAGIVLPHEDEAEVARRFEAIAEVMQPNHDLARQVVGRLALMGLRMERCAEHEAKATAFKMRRAIAEFDEARMAEVERLLERLPWEPATSARRLRGMPEGVDALIRVLARLRDDLAHDGLWRLHEHGEKLNNALGLRWVETPYTRARCLGEGMFGQFERLGPADAADLPKDERMAWSKRKLIELIGAEIEALHAHRATLDHETLALDRAEAPARVMFDPSKEAVLARKYEGAAEGSFFRHLKAYEAINAMAPQAAEDQELEPEPVEQMGSCLPEAPGDDAEADGEGAEGLEDGPGVDRWARTGSDRAESRPGSPLEGPEQAASPPVAA